VEYHLSTPVSREAAEKLRAGDVVYLTGTIITARDKAHVRMIDYFRTGRQLPFSLDGTALFHGAPLVRKKDGRWEIVAIGPTTSARLNALEPPVIGRGARLIIGKGGMDRAVLDALHANGAAYLSMTGGVAVLGARMVRRVAGVFWEDLGLAEAVWSLDVAGFGPLTVTMDAHGRDLYETVQKAVSENINAMWPNK